MAVALVQNLLSNASCIQMKHLLNKQKKTLKIILLYVTQYNNSKSFILA